MQITPIPDLSLSVLTDAPRIDAAVDMPFADIFALTKSVLQDAKQASAPSADVPDQEVEKSDIALAPAAVSPDVMPDTEVTKQGAQALQQLEDAPINEVTDTPPEPAPLVEDVGVIPMTALLVAPKMSGHSKGAIEQTVFGKDKISPALPLTVGASTQTAISDEPVKVQELALVHPPRQNPVPPNTIVPTAQFAILTPVTPLLPLDMRKSSAMPIVWDVAQASQPEQPRPASKGVTPALPQISPMSFTSALPPENPSQGTAVMTSLQRLSDEGASHGFLPALQAAHGFSQPHNGPNMAPSTGISPTYTAAQTPQGIGAAQQVAMAITTSADGAVDIALNPEDLGRVRLVLSTTDAGVALAITAERPETQDLMRRHLDSLAQEMKALGFKDVSFSFDGQSSNQRRHDSQNDDPSHVPHEDVRNVVVQTGQHDGLDLRL